LSVLNWVKNSPRAVTTSTSFRPPSRRRLTGIEPSAFTFHEVEMMSYPLFEHQPYTLALATKMATVAENENLDLLHVHYAIPHSISAILARESIKSHRRLPVITTLHGTDITLVGADRSYLPITKYGLEQSDGVTAISNYLKQSTIEHFGFDRIEVIPNFVCPEDYKPKIDCELREAMTPDARR